MSVVDDYLKDVSPAEKAALERIRQLVLEVAPETEEVITYGMPGFKYKKKYLIAFAEFKDHLSIFPGAEAIETNKKALTAFKLSKGTVQFTLDNPISDETLKAIIISRVETISK